MDAELVKVRIKFRPSEDLPEGEGLWARPVEAHEGGGTYELQNNSFMVPLAIGDLVRAELDGDGVLQMTDFVRPGEMTLSVIGLDQARCDVEAVIDGWARQGAEWTEGSGRGLMVTAWKAMSTKDVLRVITSDVEPGELLMLMEPRQRAKELDDIDLELDRTVHFPPVETDYWAADDPYWSSIGRDDPDFLSLVQALAGDDARVARALERGQQDRVLTYIERITAPDPRALPPLDGPIFDDE